MWQSSLPLVETMAECPSLVTERKWWGVRAAFSASTAMRTFPSVPFLKPTGQESPDASSPRTCHSVVRVPCVIGQLFGFFRAGKFAQEEGGWRELLDLSDSDVVEFEVQGCRRCVAGIL